MSGFGWNFSWKDHQFRSDSFCAFFFVIYFSLVNHALKGCLACLPVPATTCYVCDTLIAHSCLAMTQTYTKTNCAHEPVKKNIISKRTHCVLMWVLGEGAFPILVLCSKHHRIVIR